MTDVTDDVIDVGDMTSLGVIPHEPASPSTSQADREVQGPLIDDVISSSGLLRSTKEEDLAQELLRHTVIVLVLYLLCQYLI